MVVDFKTIKKVGKFTIEIVDNGDDRFDVVMFKNDTIINQIGVTKDNIKDIMDFVNRK